MLEVERRSFHHANLASLSVYLPCRSIGSLRDASETACACLCGPRRPRWMYSLLDSNLVSNICYEHHHVMPPTQNQKLSNTGDLTHPFPGNITTRTLRWFHGGSVPTLEWSQHSTPPSTATARRARTHDHSHIAIHISGQPSHLIPDADIVILLQKLTNILIILQ